jgi:hypothetical protein
MRALTALNAESASKTLSCGKGGKWPLQRCSSRAKQLRTCQDGKLIIVKLLNKSFKLLKPCPCLNFQIIPTCLHLFNNEVIAVAPKDEEFPVLQAC